ncbi:MAG: RNA polymerase sigma factor [Mesorhizobium sp.]|uniref:RNA polymerase sigma factor n=1 Tax=unclassified Mesorhizobium TaxID=325217 RepID=UPI000F765539|nr:MULTISPECIES: RNA polymerase sigma factor [unclassified Mesorhizobium]AZO70602.1 RNA polymerase sigma factor [Mesorhizobium sp. M1D.F.Ca.ET.043.01.1.1]RWA91912.1 MAG: sigma-70 family RNA polymerase sigma factor [Mesorhizobium sp.]RWE15827.1 MAG: sigma-70 family RNA polymerase sigma factor [Mesorhizobium sp.]TJW88532.1 MAG: RNA polymerase sigma factor [Mesorhizobium sp.]
MTTAATIEAVWRIEQPKLAARLTRYLRDVGLAEEVVQDAFVLALERWPRNGIPRHPAAWLSRVATNQALDRLRRTVMLDGKHRELAIDLAELERKMPDIEAALDEDIGDDLLRLIFTTCHPVLPAEQRAALALRMLGGLTTSEIARAFLVSEATVAQRIVRAKRALRDAGIAFETPRAEERRERLATVLEVIYLIFNEGYVASAGSDWLRADLCGEALRLGRLLAALMPEEPEALGLVALMEFNASRFAARTDKAGNPILLLDQDRSRWNWSLIRRGLDGLNGAMALTPTPGPYLLQAMITACHARAVSVADTDWIAIASYYQALALAAPSPIVEVNRAVAVGMAFGPAQGLAIADALQDEARLKDSHLLPTVRGDLLEKLGRIAEAHAEFRRAAELTGNERERALLLARAGGGEANSR